MIHVHWPIADPAARLKDYADELEVREGGIHYYTGSFDWQIVQDIRAILNELSYRYPDDEMSHRDSDED